MRAPEPIAGIRLVAFDLDGVLVDSFECWRMLLNDTLAQHGQREQTREEFAACWGQDAEADRKRFFPDWAVAELIAHYNAQFPRFVEWIREEPGAAEVLARLKQAGFTVAVASNSPTEMVERLLQRASLRSHVDHAAGVDLVAHGKPEPDLIEYVRHAAGVPREAVCFVGDSEYDARAARAAGVLFVGFRRAGDRRIESLRELLDLVAA
jgi:phosphoglycolate phosphatase